MTDSDNSSVITEEQSGDETSSLGSEDLSKEDHMEEGESSTVVVGATVPDIDNRGSLT